MIKLLTNIIVLTLVGVFVKSMPQLDVYLNNEIFMMLMMPVIHIHDSRKNLAEHLTSFSYYPYSHILSRNNAFGATRSASIFHSLRSSCRRIVAKISKTMSKLSAYLHRIGVFEMTGAVTGAPLSQTHKSLSGRTKPLSLFPRLLKQHTFWHIYGPCCSFDIHR